MIRVLLTACLVGSVISKTCESLPNLSTNQTLDGKDRISSFFAPGHCLAVDAKMNAADLHGNKNAKLYWADCKNVADDSKTPFTLTNKRGKSVQVVVAEFQHFAIKIKNRLQNDFSLIKLKDGYKQDRCITVSGFSDISNGVRLQMSRCDKNNAKMRFTGHAAGLWVYRNKKRSKWCLWPPMKTGDTAKVGACISGLLGGSKSLAKINGNWANWTKSGSCSKACGSGKQNFTRTCSNPAPAHGGNACSGSSSKFETCNPQPCAVNGNWTVWSKSGACSQPCGTAPKGKQNYTRTCTAPKPDHGGNNCTGSTEKFEYCNTSIKCPINGNWTVWNKSGNCSQACGTDPRGKQNYTRTCTAPKPAHGGNNCTGSTEKSEYCNTSIKCPVSSQTVLSKIKNDEFQQKLTHVADKPFHSVALLNNTIYTAYKKIYEINVTESPQVKSYESGHDFEIRCIDATHDFLVTGSMDKTVRLWRRQGMKHIHTITDHFYTIRRCRFIENALVTGSDDKTAIIYELSDQGAPTKRHVLRGHTAPVYDVDVSTDHIVTASVDTNLMLWNRQTGELLKTMRGHLSRVFSVRFLDASHFASLSMDNTLKIWNVNQETAIKTLDHGTFGVSIAVHDNIIYSTRYHSKEILAWDYSAGPESMPETPFKVIPTKHTDRMSAIDATSTRIVTTDYKGSITTIDINP